MAKKKKKNTFVSWLVFLVMSIFCIVMINYIGRLEDKLDTAKAKEASLEEELAEAKAEAERLLDNSIFRKTLAYVEQVAREKLGLVYPDEIIVKPRE